MQQRCRRALAVWSLTIGIAAANVAAQMVDPAIDHPAADSNAPFSYYSHPTDKIGVTDAPSGTLVSPEGFLYNVPVS